MAHYHKDMKTIPHYSLEEMGRLTGLSPRTIRNYIQKGLLPGAEARGRGAFYTDLHLNRLRCIQIIRERSGLPLDELRRVMQTLPEEQIQRIGTGEEDVVALPVGQAYPPVGGLFSVGEPLDETYESDTMQAAPSAEEPSSALDYIRQLRGGLPGDQSRFAELIKALERLTGGQRVYRKAKNEWWATVKVTEDMEIRVRGLDEKDIGQLERLADLLRSLIMKGVKR